MKTLRFFVMALAITAFPSSAFNARAQTTLPPNQQNVNGTATVDFNQVGPSNDPYNGEYAGGDGSGQYIASDPISTTGTAGGTGVGTGINTGLTTSNNGTAINASGNSNSTINTFASATGADANVTVSAVAYQGTYSSTSTDPNATTFANASEGTNGGYSGNGTANGTINQNGTGTSNGTSSVSVVNLGNTNTNVTSTFNATGNSMGTITASSNDPAANQQVSATVGGGLAANSGSLAGSYSSGTFADATASGGASYYASAPNSIQGAGEVSGQTNGVVGTNTANQVSVSASSVVTSKAETK